jgi:Rrf2 family protein
MKISAQEEYGLRCLLRLAQSGEKASATLPEIAAAEGLSVPYAAKLLSVLRQAGLIESVRGRSGGYRLAQAPDTIGLGSLLLTLGEPLFDDPGYCERHAGSTGSSNCVHHNGCSLKALWQTLEQWVRHGLDRITLADLLRGGGDIGTLVRSRLAQVVFEPQPELLTLTLVKPVAEPAATLE